MGKKKIAVVGLYSIPNMGDKILCEVTQYLIKERIENIELIEVDVSPRNSEIYDKKFHKCGYRISQYMNSFAKRKFKYENKSKFRYYFEYLSWYIRMHAYFIKNLKDVDAIIFAGGGFIKFRTQGLNYFVEQIVKIAMKNNIPTMLNGCGIEGYSEEDIRCQKLKKALNQNVVKVVTTRDDIDILKNNYITNKNTEISRVGDPALWTPECYGLKRNEERNVVGINIIRGKVFSDYGNKMNQYQLRNFYLNLIEAINKKGWNWVVFSNGMKSDQVEANAVLETLGEKIEEKLLPSPTTSEEMLDYIIRFKCIFGARLHADITAYSLDVPVVAFDWSEKTLIFSQIIGKPNNFFNEDSLNIENIIKRMEESFEETYDKEIREELKNLTVKYMESFIKQI